MSERTITVTLTEREARALARTANLLSSALGPEAEACRCEGDPAVPPLVSGAMRLELALVAEGCEA